MRIFSSVTDGQIVLQTSKLLFLKIILKKKCKKKKKNILYIFLIKSVGLQPSPKLLHIT
jgi:hypothetical protein